MPRLTPPIPSRPRVCHDQKGVAWMMTFLDQTGAAALMPEMFLAVAAMALLMIGVFRRQAGEFIEIAAALVIWMPATRPEAFGGAFVVDTFARVMKVLVLFGSAVAVILSVNF